MNILFLILFLTFPLTANATRLQVTGGGSSSGGSGSVGIGTANWNAIYSNSSTVIASNVLQTIGSNIGIGTAASTSKLMILGSGTNSSTSSFAVRDSSGAPEFYLGDDGSVGIGTESPLTSNAQYFVNVYKNTNALRILALINKNAGTSAAVGFGLDTSDTSGYLRQYPTNSSNARAGRIVLNAETGGTGLSLVGDAGDIRLDTSGAEAMRLTSTQNVGIGSITPGTKLDVTGTIRATALSGPLTGNASTATALAANGTNCSAGSYPLGVDASGNSEGCASVANSSSQWQTQTSIGIGTVSAVGIGTYTFGNSLSVVGNVGIGTGIGQAYVTTAPDGNGMIVQGNIGIGTTKNSTSALTVMGGNVGIGTWIPGAALDVMGGNIGLGTTTPKYLLHIKDAITTTSQPSDLGIVLQSSENSARVGGFALGGGTDFVSGSFSNTKMNFISNNGSGVCLTFATDNTISWQQSTCTIGTSTRLLIDPNGNIGIGTFLANNAKLLVQGGNVGIGSVTPGTSLDINGTMRLIGTGAASFIIQAGSNTACTTTCTTGRAIVGLDDGTLGVALPHLVGPTDATAEECLCGK